MQGRARNGESISRKYELTSEPWVKDGEAWVLAECPPVYRKPNSDWVAFPNSSTQKIWFIPELSGDENVDPNTIEFAKWVTAAWDAQAGRWVYQPAASSVRIGRVKADITFGNSGTITLLGSESPGSPLAVLKEVLDEGSEEEPEDLEVTAYHDLLDAWPTLYKNSHVIVRGAEHGEPRIVAISLNNIWRGTTGDGVPSGGVGTFQISSKSGTLNLTAISLSTIPAGGTAAVFIGGDNQPYAIGSASSVKFCPAIGLQPGTYRAVVDRASSSGAGFDITLEDQQLTPDGLEEFTLTEVESRGDNSFYEDTPVTLHVDVECNYWIESNAPKVCLGDASAEGSPSTGLVLWSSYPGKIERVPGLSAGQISSSADTVVVRLELGAVNREAVLELGTELEVTADWWGNGCPREGQKVMLHVTDGCTYYATGGLDLGGLEEGSFNAKPLGVEEGCVVTIETMESCSEDSTG